MRTLLEPSGFLQNTGDLLVRLLNSSRATLLLVALLLIGTALLGMAEQLPDPSEEQDFEVCPACVADLWFTPPALSRHGKPLLDEVRSGKELD